MLQSNKRILQVLTAFAVVAATVLAQQSTTKMPPRSPGQQTPQQESDLAKFTDVVRRVACPTTVVDRNGHLVTDLPQSAFTVYENGKPQNIIDFKREDVPVSLGLIIDNSGSMREKRKRVERAALDLALASNKDDEVFVVNFNDRAYLDLPHEKDFTKYR